MGKLGIDISKHQGNIDLETLKNNGVEFVIIRVGYGTKGTIDTKFTRNADLCVQLGIPMGFYWYSYALDVEGAEKEANAFLNAIAPYTPEYGCWFDMEDADNYKQKNGMPSNETLRDICYKFCEIVEAAGYYTGVYASESWLENQLAGDRLSRFDKWVAQWPTLGGKQKGLSVNASSRSDVTLWQFTSQAKITGYNGNLDANYAYKTFPNPAKTTTTENNNTSTSTSTQKFNIGDKVIINGSLYKSSTASSASGSVSNKVTNITRYAAGAAHPYNTTGDLGWMNESDITAYSDNAGTSTATIKKGSKVKFNGTKSYSGIKLADWTKGATFDVIQVSGDRVVIGKGTAVTAAVKMSDCELV